MLPPTFASGTVVTRSNTLRIAPPTTSGRWSIIWFDMLVETFASSLWSRAFLASTFTVSVTAPGFRITSMRAVAPAVSRMPSTVADWNPSIEASTR